MMSRVLMGAGSWSLELEPDTPRYIKRMFPRKDGAGTDWWWTHIIFTAVDQLVYDTNDPTALPAVFAGPVWSRGQKMTRFGGPHMAGWMSNQRGDAAPNLSGSGGTEYPTGWSATPKTITEIVQSWFPLSGAMNGIRYGTAYSAPGTTIEGLDIDSYRPLTKRPLDDLMAQVGCEYRVTNSSQLDWGVPASLFAGHTSPSVLVAEDIRTSSGTIRALNATVSVDDDINGFRNWARVASSDGLGLSLGPVTVVDTVVAHFSGGGPAHFGPGTITINAPAAAVSAAKTAASEEFASANRRISATCDDFCVMELIEPGDCVYVWSPDDFVEDATGTTEIIINGRAIRPEILRVTQIDQPFQEGMGAYIAQWNGSDYETKRITDYVKVENQPTRLTIGSRPTPPSTNTKGRVQR